MNWIKNRIIHKRDAERKMRKRKKEKFDERENEKNIERENGKTSNEHRERSWRQRSVIC